LYDVTISDPKLTPATTTCEGPVAPGGTCVLVGTYAVTQEDMDACVVNNTATATATDPQGIPVSSNPALAVVAGPCPVGALNLSKIPDRQTFSALGEVITYTITATNTGSVSLYDVTISDPKLIPTTITCEGPVAPGGTCVLVGTYAVTQEDMDACVVNNTATATATDPQGIPVSSNPASAVVTGNCPQDLTIIKEGPERFGAVGEVLSYTITTTNTGKVTLYDVIITDAKLTPSTVTCDTLAPGGTCVLVGTYTVTQEDMDGCVVNNTATVTGTGSDGVTLTAEASKTVPGDACEANIDLVKEGPERFDAVGEVLSYTITATNTGKVTLSNVIITDAKLTPSTTTCDTLAPGGTCVLTGTYVVAQADMDACVVNNTATVTGTGSDGATLTAEASKTVPGDACEANIGLVKEGPESFDAVGEVLSYTITATNTGKVTLSNVIITDAKLTPSTATCDTLAPGGTCVLTGTYVVAQADMDACAVNNTATVAGTGPDGVKVTAEASKTVPGKDCESAIVLEKTASPKVFSASGNIITYAFTVTNTGKTTLTDVMVADAMSTVSGVPLAQLAPGASDSTTFTAAYTITQADLDAGSFTNTATVTAKDPQGSTVSDEDSETVTCSGCGPDLAIDKNAVQINTTSSDSFAAGDDEFLYRLDYNVVDESYPAVFNLAVERPTSITYEIVVTNTGNVTLENVEVKDARVALDQVIERLAPQESRTFSAVLALPFTDADIPQTTEDPTQVDVSDVENTASAKFTYGETTREVSDTVTVGFALEVEIPTYNPSIALVKTAVETEFRRAGETITYTFTVKNTGDIPLNNITISDPKATVTGGPLAELLPGAEDTTTFTATYVITEADVEAEQFVNTAMVTGTDPQGKQVTAQAEATVILKPCCCEGFDPAELLWGLLTLIPLYIISLFNGGEIITPINHS